MSASNETKSSAAHTGPRRAIRPRKSFVVLLGGVLTVAGAVLVYRQASADTIVADAQSVASAAAVADAPQMSDGVFRFSAEFANRAGIVTVVAEERDLAPIVEVTGQVDFSPGYVAAVGTRIFGHVDDVRVLPGERVEAGQPLARLVSSDLGEAQARLSTADAMAEFAAADRARKERLVAEGIAGDRRAQVAARDLESANAQRRAAAQSIRAMGGVPSPQAVGEFLLRSPIDGEVVEMNVSRGQAVPPDHQAFKIADLSKVWLALAVYERDLARIRVGDEVTVHPNGEEESTVVTGVVAHVSSIIDRGTRTAEVRVQVENEARHLRIGQAVEAHIRSLDQRVRALAIPRDAVILVDGEHTVFVSPGEGEAIPRRVKIGAHSSDYVEVVDGLEPGERVVTGGVQQLKTELFR